jgi:hypothetical protein
MRKPEGYNLESELRNLERWQNTLNKVKARFPDAAFVGQVMVSENLTAAECNSVVYDKDSKSIRACVWIDDIPICYCHSHETQYRRAIFVDNLNGYAQLSDSKQQMLADLVTGYERSR